MRDRTKTGEGDKNRKLQKTYLPNQVAIVRLADAGRVKRRQRMRTGGK